MKKIIVSLSSLALVISLVAPMSLAQYEGSTSFKGTTPYQAGMSLDEAQGLAQVSQADAITLTGNSAESATAELTVVDGFLVWAVTSGDQVTFVDINNPDLKMNQQSAPASTDMDGEYEDDDYEDGDYEDEEYEDEDYEDSDEYEEHEEDYSDKDSDEDYSDKDSGENYNDKDSDEDSMNESEDEKDDD